MEAKRSKHYTIIKDTMDTHPVLMQLIIGYTCVGVFVATALAVILDLFGWVKIDTGLKKKLHVVLILEIVSIALVTFSDLAKLNTQTASFRINISAVATADKLD